MYEVRREGNIFSLSVHSGKGRGTLSWSWMPLPSPPPRTGVPPPRPGQGYLSLPSLPGQWYPSRVRVRAVVTGWAVCLLSSRRRTFLLANEFSVYLKLSIYLFVHIYIRNKQQKNICSVICNLQGTQLEN